MPIGAAWLAALMTLPGLVAAQREAPAPNWEWNTDDDLEGWGREHSLTPPVVSDGLLRAQLTSTDPWIVGPAMQVDATKYQFLALRLRVTHFGGGAIYWAREDDPQFSQEKMVQFRLTSDTEFTEVLLDLRGHPEWTGTITQLRLDPIDLYPTAVEDQQVEVDSLRFVANAERPPQVVVGRLHGPSTVLVPPRESFELRLPLMNVGGQAAEGLEVTLRLPPGAAAMRALAEAPTALAPGEQAEVAWSVTPRQAGPLPAAVTVRCSNHPTLCAALRTLAVPPDMPDSRTEVSIAGVGIVAPQYEFGWGPIFVGPASRPAQPTALLPSAGAVFYLDEQDTLCAWEVAGSAPLATIVDDRDVQRGLQVQARSPEQDGVRFTASMAIADAGTSGVLRLRHEVESPEDVRVLAFCGPTIYLGEPTGGTTKQDAIFPGLEWLVGDEQSSSDIDCTGPERFRYVPHPNKITVPAMGVRAGGTLFGLLWNARQEWAPGCDRPSAVFSVPNTLEGRDGQLMALMAPSVPRFMPENGTLASEPYVLEAGEKLRLDSYLVCRPADNSADIVLDWINLYGLPEPADSPRTDPLEALAFTVNAYLDALWVPEERGWLNAYGPPAQTAAHWPFMRDMTVAGRILPHGELRQRVREQVSQARGDVAGNFGVETALYDGALIPLVSQRLRSAVERDIADQDEEGGWGFAPDPAKRGTQRDPFTLGPAGQVELGTCARKAHSLLKFARIAQDKPALEAGLKALRRMAQFEVPRAAQVWEVPVHSPDVLAAAQAVRAYVEGYGATQEDEWLAEAVRWARRGVPFIYLWDSGEYPYMLYGSIPVFGATWFTGSWFGRLVQWNGSEYAIALLELAEFDDSLPWRKIAEGIITSAAIQQSDEGRTKGMYPDSCNLMNGSTADFYVAPYHHCEGLVTLTGTPALPQTAFVPVDDERVAITAAADITKAAYQPKRRVIRFTCTFADGGRHHILIANSPPAAVVRVNGAECPQQDDLWPGEELAWAHDAPARMTEVRVARGKRAEIALKLAD